MRIARRLRAQRVDGSMRAAQQCSKVRPAKSEIHRLLRPLNNAYALAVGRYHPDAPRPGAIYPAKAIDLQAIRYARLRAFLHIGEDTAPNHVAGRVELDPVDVFRR